MELPDEQPVTIVLQNESKLLSTTSFNRICRTCLKCLGEHNFNIFEVICKDINLSDVFANYIAVQVEENDNLPQNVCTSCISKFIEMYGFIQQCEYADVMLRTELKNRNKCTIEMNENAMNIVNTIKSSECDIPPEVEKLLTSEDNEEVIPFLEEVDVECTSSHTDINTHETPLEDSKFFFIDPDTTIDSKEDISHILHSIKESDSETEYCEDLQANEYVTENSCESQSTKGYHVMEPCPFQYSCKRCEKYFDSLIKLQEHRKQYHTRHVCINCNKTISTRHNLQLHVAKCKKTYFHRYANENQETKPKELLEKLIKASNFPFTIYTCRKCNTFFESQDGLKMHRKQVRHVRAHNYVCPKCSKTVSSKYNLKEHMKTHTEEELSQFDLNLDLYSIPNNDFTSKQDSLSNTTENEQNNYLSKLLKQLLQSDKSSNTFHGCSNCNLLFASYDEFTMHQKLMNHPKKEHQFNYVCSICSKKCDRPSSLKQHMKTHTKEKAFACEICQMRFSLKCNLQRHMMTHTNERPHVCKVCNKGFIQANSLTEHVRINHTGEKPFGCSYCGKHFARRAKYLTHLQIHHTKKELRPENSTNVKTNKHPLSSKLFKCNVCQRYLRSRTCLKQHMALHGEKSLLCSQCGKSFAVKSGLLSHMKMHTGVKPYVCTICKKTFSQSESLKCHLRIHTGEKPFVCKICSKSFRQSAHLMYHMRMHNKEKSYKCSYCEKSFRTNGNLTAHKRIHTGETPFSCDVCNKRFYHSNNLKKHKKVHDKKKNVIRSIETSAEVSKEEVMS